MADQNLKINISADASQASAGFKSAATSANNFGSALQDAREKVETFRAKLELLNATALKGDVGKNLAVGLKGATAELKALEKQAGITGEVTTNAFSKAYSGIRQLAYILPGIGVAGIFNVLGEGLVSVIKSFADVGTAAISSNDIIKSAGKEFQSAANDVETLRINIDLAKNGFISKEGVVKQYNETLGKTTGFVKTLDEAEAALNKNADAYVRFTLLKAAANVALEKAAGEAFEAEKTRQRSAAEFQNAIVDTRVSSGGIGLGGGTFNAKDFDAETKRIADAQEKRKQILVQKSTDQQTVLENIAKKFQADAAKIAKDSNFNFFGDNEQTKTKTGEQLLNGQITAINKQIAALEELRRQGIATRADISELFNLKIKKIDLELPKSGFSSQQALAFKNRLEDEATKAIAADGIKVDLPKITIEGLDKDGGLFSKFDLKGNPIELKPGDITIDTSLALKSAIDAGKGTAVTIRDGLSQGINNVDIGAAFTKTLQNNLVDAVSGIAEGIGAAFSGGGFSSVLKSVGESVGQFIQDFGKLLIKSAIEISVLQKAVKALALSPLAALAVGIAAIAIGAIIKNASAGSQKKFASGAVVTGPTNALIGEAGPEVVFPLNQINKFIKGVSGGGGMDVSFAPLQTFTSSSGIYQTYHAEAKRRGRGTSGG